MTKYTRAGDILQRAAAMDYPVVSCRGTCWQGEAQWVRVLTSAHPVELDEIDRQLRPIEERQSRLDEQMRELDRRSAEQHQRDREARRAVLRDLLGE